ncbi:head GIN domain-containing protein [Flavobacterium ardleyense]|uniref:Head GIN domain-containing protein n=1 Tax=Flavobacterium ardleyense TaxID=2038737 RepID=A0ABW5Z7Y0_9FLAO
MKNYIYIFIISLLFTVTSCGISEDCFKGNGKQITQSFPLENFTKIKVYDGVGLVVKEGANYEVKITTSDNIIDNLDVKLDGDMLVVKDNSTCNIARDYGLTTVYVTVPDGTNFPLIQELELHSKTDQQIKSEGILHSTIVRLFSIDLSDGAGTGDFHINVENSQLVVESNNVSNFYISGNCDELLINFYFGNGRCYGADLNAENVKVYHRGSNDMFVYPIQKIEGTISATGNVVLKNVPPIVNVEEVFRGRLIY